MTEPSEEVEELIDAARYGDYEDVSTALDNKTPVNGTDALGRSALHMACANGHAGIVHLLISAGADVTLANAEGNVPLHWACLNGHVEIVKLLLEAGASPSALNSYERTPIDEALNHMRCDDILGVINAATSNGGTTPNEGSFSFGTVEAEGGSAFPQKPQ